MRHSIERLMFFSISTALITAACGSMEMPDSGVTNRMTSSNGGTAVGSTETVYDLSKCGFDLSKPGATIASRRMAMTPKPMTVTTKILGGILTSQMNVTFSGMSIIEDSLSRSVSTYTAQSTPAVNSDEVTALIAKYTGGFSSDILAPAARSKIGETNPDWKGVFCSFQPATKIERGLTEKITVNLDKPLPVSPLIVADLARLKLEMGVKRSWPGITATVSESTDSNVQVGTTWTGQVNSQPVTASTIIDGANGKVTVKSDLAVKITYDFGSEAANKALGLPKSIIWYLSAATKSYLLTQIDFGDGVPINYLPDK